MLRCQKGLALCFKHAAMQKIGGHPLFSVFYQALWLSEKVLIVLVRCVDLTIYELDSIACLDLCPVLCWKIYVGHGLVDIIRDFLCGGTQLIFPELFCDLSSLFAGSLLAFLSVDRLEYNSNGFYLIVGIYRKYVRVKMDRTALITGIQKHFWDRFRYIEILISDYQTYSTKAPFFELDEERTPAFVILFHAFGSTPTALQINTIDIDVRIIAGQWTGTPFFLCAHRPFC